MCVVLENYGTFRVEDLLKPDIPEKCVEIVAGSLVVMTPAGKYHNRVAFRFQVLFQEFCETKPNLDFGGDNEGFLLRRNPDLLLSPDACLFRKRPETESPWLEFSPEVVVEVLSASNNPSEMAYKVRKYLDAGTEQVWIASLENRSLEIVFRDGHRLTAQGTEKVEGEGIAQGVLVDLDWLFYRD